MFDSLSGKKIVVVGEGSGVDLEIIQKLPSLGVKLVLAIPSQEKLDQAGELISSEIEVKILDGLNEAGLNAFFAEVGSFDHLIVTSIGDRNMPRSILTEMSTEIAQGDLEKFWRTFFAVRASLKTIAKEGSITLTSGTSIFKGSKMGGISAIAAANGAIASFGRSLALELAPIRVNIIASGLFEDSSIWTSQGEQELADLTKWGTAALPVEHLGQPEEFIQAVLSLITNTYMTGVVLPVDGGVTLI